MKICSFTVNLKNVNLHNKYNMSSAFFATSGHTSTFTRTSSQFLYENHYRLIYFEKNKKRNSFGRTLYLLRVTIDWLSQMPSARRLFFSALSNCCPSVFYQASPKKYTHTHTHTLTWTTRFGTSQFREHWTSLLISRLPLTICWRLDTGDLQTWLTTWMNPF